MARRPSADRDTFVPSVGFVLAGFGVAASFLRWSHVVSVGPVESLPGVLTAGIAFLAFAARRYGHADHRLTAVAGLGSGGLTGAAVVTLLHPSTIDSSGKAVGIGVWAAIAIGILALGVAYADWAGLNRSAFLGRSRQAVAGLGIGIVGLLVGFLTSAIGGSLIGPNRPLLQQGVGTVAFSVGLGLVALGFLRVTHHDRSYIDVAGLGKRDWLYVIGGVLAMFAILLGLGVLSGLLGIPSTQHGLIQEAKQRPHILLYFIPLSWLAIGPGEELLSRNIIQKYLYESFSRRGSVVVATVIFTLIHLPAYATGGPAAIFATLVRLFVISLVLGVVYERTENVVASALVHGTYDAVQFGLAYLAIVSGFI